MALQRRVLCLRRRDSNQQDRHRSKHEGKVRRGYADMVAALYPLALTRSSDKVWQSVLMIAAGAIFALALFAQTPPPAPSGVDAGRVLFEGKGQCLSCHTVGDSGRPHGARSELDWASPHAGQAARGRDQSHAHKARDNLHARRNRSPGCLSAHPAHAYGRSTRAWWSGTLRRQPKMPRFSIARSATRKSAPRCS